MSREIENSSSEDIDDVKNGSQGESVFDIENIQDHDYPFLWKE